MVLAQLQTKIPGTRLWKNHGLERLYFNIRRWKDRKTEAKVWLEVVNDRLQFRANVFNDRKEIEWWRSIEEQICDDISKQYHELIYDCELKRKETPIHERLKDNVPPVYDQYGTGWSLPHQIEAVTFLCNIKVGALFSDKPGVGKSKIAIDLAVSRYMAGRIKKVLVFCPVSTKVNFRIEIEKYCPACAAALEWNIIGIESMSSSNKTFFAALNYADAETMIIIDESHLVKTHDAKRSSRIHLVCHRSTYKLIMTATPVTDNVHNLFMQYSMLSDLVLEQHNWYQFQEKYLLYGGFNGDEVIGHKNLDYLAGLVEPYTFQVNKDAVQLPPLTFETVECPLTELQEELYYSYKEELLQKIEDDNITSETIFLFLTRMQQVVCGYHDEQYIGNTKMEELDRRLDGKQKIIFCKYLFEVDMVIEHLGRDKCALFTGENPKERDAEKELFTTGHKLYFVSTMGSGGTGLNGLQVCSNIINMSNSFKYSERKQCIGRIERKGQKQQMQVLDLITSSGIDTKIVLNLARKKGLEEEIRELLSEKTKDKLRKYVNEL